MDNTILANNSDKCFVLIRHIILRELQDNSKLDFNRLELDYDQRLKCREKEEEEVRG